MVASRVDICLTNVLRKMAKTKVMNVRLPRDVLLVLDSLVERGTYKSRSEAIRKFVREYVLENRGGANAG